VVLAAAGVRMQSDRIQQRINTFLDEADEAAARSDWARVRDRAQNVLAFDPQNSDALSYIAAADRALTSALPVPSPSTGEGEGGGETSPEPTSFAGGRYQVKKLLGEGGKKRVYLAHDAKLDRDVAFALIKTDGLNAEGEARIRREAQAMGKLGDHPHIVPVYDIGEEGGQPYLVTQLMGGGDVEGLIEKTPDQRLPLEVVLRIADQVCQALEYANSKGIVHRDLKPGNVWLTADPSGGTGQVTAKLGDFGLAVALDRSRLTQAGMMVGTVSYMPPEQATGGEVTARSDLYSLGAMLYEMVCGRPPFVGDESVAIIGQHLNTPPVAPTWHRPDCPSGLEELILRLLEKDATRRPASAAEVREALASISRGQEVAGDGRSAESRVAGGPAADNPIYRRAFVGRESELRQLEAAFDRAVSGGGTLTMVVGEPGIGKTALCEQLATYSALRGGRTLVGHCYEEGSFSIPYLPFVEALRTYVLAREPEDLRKDLGSGAGEVARIISEVRDRVAVEPPPPGDPDDDRWRLLQAVTGFLRNATGVQPIVLVLEDLHWADRGTLDLLVHLARNLQGARLLVVGTYRDVEVDRAHPLSATLAELRRVGDLPRVLLRGLTPDEVHRMINAISGQEVRWALAEAVHRQTEGNPLFVQEVLRYLVEEELIVRKEGRWEGRWRGDSTAPAPELNIPEGLRDVIGKRLSKLSPECNRLLSIAAVIGRDFRLDTLQVVAAPSTSAGQGLSEEEVIGGLEEATHVGVLEEQSRVGIVRYRFAHAFFRQTLYEEMSAPRRLRVHQEVALALERQYAARPEEHATELAEHFAQSTDPENLKRAVGYGELAAQRAMAVYAFGEAARHLEAALEVQEVLDPDDRARRCDLLLALCEALGPAGEGQRVAEEVAEQAFALAEALGDGQRASRAAWLAEVEGLRRYAGGAGTRSPQFQEWAERLDRYAAPGTRERVAADSMNRRVLLNIEGRWSDGWALQERAREAARQLEDVEQLIETFLSNLQAPRGWSSELAFVRSVAALPRTELTTASLAILLMEYSFVCLEDGDREGAERAWQEREQLATRSRDALLALAPLVHEGERLALDGDLEGAVAAGTRLVTRGDELGSAVRARGDAENFMFRPLLHLGRPEEALAAAFGAAERSGWADRPSYYRVGERALCLAHMGRSDEARAELVRELARVTISPDTPIRILSSLLETAVVLQDREAAALLAPLLVEVTSYTYPMKSVALLVGQAEALLGDRAAARAHYQRSLEWATKIRFRPEIALTRLAMAELLLDEGAAPEAQNHLDFVIEEFRAMKMQPALERALSHKGLLKA